MKERRISATRRFGNWIMKSNLYKQNGGIKKSLVLDGSRVEVKIEIGFALVNGD